MAGAIHQGDAPVSRVHLEGSEPLPHLLPHGGVRRALDDLGRRLVRQRVTRDGLRVGQAFGAPSLNLADLQLRDGGQDLEGVPAGFLLAPLEVEIPRDADGQGKQQKERQ